MGCVHPQGHAFEGRLYAEVPQKDFLPATGTVKRWVVPAGATAFAFEEPPGGVRVRVDSGVQEGDQVGRAVCTTESVLLRDERVLHHAWCTACWCICECI